MSEDQVEISSLLNDLTLFFEEDDEKVILDHCLDTKNDSSNLKTAEQRGAIKESTEALHTSSPVGGQVETERMSPSKMEKKSETSAQEEKANPSSLVDAKEKANGPGCSHRKKTSEASPLADHVLLANLMQENQMLKQKNEEIISINHDWDKSYTFLAQQHADLQKEFHQNVEQLSNAITAKDAEKNRMKMKLERFFNEDSVVEKLAEEREEKNTILKREQAALQTVKDLQLKCQYLEHNLQTVCLQKRKLEEDLLRMNRYIESKNQNKNCDNSGQNHGQPNAPHNSADPREVELLRQQLQTYAEDFNAEKVEKQKCQQVGEELSRKLSASNEENEHLRRQLLLYEKDFFREREKRIQLMRKSNPTPRTMYPPVFPNGHIEDPRKGCNIPGGKEEMEHRLNGFDHDTTNSWNTLHFNGAPNCIPQYPQYIDENQGAWRSLPPSYSESKPENRKRNITTRAMPHKDSNSSNSSSNSSNSSWSYFGV